MNKKEDMTEAIADNLVECEAKCGGNFRSMFLMEDHYMSNHNKNNHFKCFYCKNVYDSANGFHGHKNWKIHGKIYTVYQETINKKHKNCQFCGRSFSSSHKKNRSEVKL